MKKLFTSIALFAIILSVASSCKGKRETCPAYGSNQTVGAKAPHTC